MRDAGSGGSMWCATLTSLVAKETTLDALHHSYANHVLYVGDKDIDGKYQIAHCHNGNNDGRETRNALYSTEDDRHHEQTEDDGDVQGIEAQSHTGGVTDGAALYHLVGHAEGDDDANAEDDAQPTLVKAVKHVVGWSTIECILTPMFEELGKRGFHEGSGGGQQSHHPHPEHGSWSAYGNC